MMKVHLLYPDRDFEPTQPIRANGEDLTQDLVLDDLFRAMARGDKDLWSASRQVMLTSLHDIDSITYRQEVLKDCLKFPDVIRQIYEMPLEFLKRKREHWWCLSSRHSSAGAVLTGAQRLLEGSVDLLHRLRRIADAHLDNFASRGFRRFFVRIQAELADEYLTTVEKHLKALRFPQGVLLSAQLGTGNEGTNYVLCKPAETSPHWLQRVLDFGSRTYSYTLHPRDDAGARVLGALRDRGLLRAARAVALAAGYIESFFNVLRFELAFYLGCLNLYEHLTALGKPVAFPQPRPADERHFSCEDLYDVTLALRLGKRVVGNDISAVGKSLIIVTGPNQGGKTCFLRSAGLAQLMMQCGMFVGGKSFSANLCAGLFTHFKREEDKTMESGKFEEELKRMSLIVDRMTLNALLLLNESLAATNEREGSEIARQIVSALLRRGIKIWYVTHLYDFARHFYERSRDKVLFLRAERLVDGSRTFKLREAAPLETSYGMDLYRKIFRLERKEPVTDLESGAATPTALSSSSSP